MANIRLDSSMCKYSVLGRCAAAEELKRECLARKLVYTSHGHAPSTAATQLQREAIAWSALRAEAVARAPSGVRAPLGVRAPTPSAERTAADATRLPDASRPLPTRPVNVPSLDGPTHAPLAEGPHRAEETASIPASRSIATQTATQTGGGGGAGGRNGEGRSSAATATGGREDDGGGSPLGWVSASLRASAAVSARAGGSSEGSSDTVAIYMVELEDCIQKARAVEEHARVQVDAPTFPLCRPAARLLLRALRAFPATKLAAIEETCQYKVSSALALLLLLLLLLFPPSLSSRSPSSSRSASSSSSRSPAHNS